MLDAAIERHNLAGRPRLVERAKDLYEDNDCDIEVDDIAPISESKDGAFVQAWVWVSYEAADIKGVNGEPYEEDEDAGDGPTDGGLHGPDLGEAAADDDGAVPQRPKGEART